MKHKIKIGTLVTVWDNSWSVVINSESKKLEHKSEVGGWLNNRAPWKVSSYGKGFPSVDRDGNLTYKNDVLLIHPETGVRCYTREIALEVWTSPAIDMERKGVESSYNKWNKISELLLQIKGEFPKECYFCTVFDNETNSYSSSRGYVGETPCPLLDSCGFCQSWKSCNYHDVTGYIEKALVLAMNITNDIKNVMKKGGLK